MSSTSAARWRIGMLILAAAACVLFNAAGLFAEDEQMFEGQITYCTCTAPDGHAAAPDNAGTAVRCPPPCTNVGPSYVLLDAKNRVAYQLDGQSLLKPFAAQDVFVIGTLNGGTIHVANIVRDLPPKIKRATTVAIVCDACPRGMAKARKAAFEQLTVWNRFAVVPDPKKADLIFLFSANRYLGDYVTRDGPDKRPVSVATTYMNVVDPRTGVSLWGDSERFGSWFVATATKDLIDELREQLEADVNPVERQSFLKRYKIPKTATDTGK